MAFDRATRRSMYWELAPEWFSPTSWEFNEAKNTLQQLRGRSLDELPHSDLLKVAKALQVISGYREGGVNDTTF